MSRPDLEALDAMISAERDAPSSPAPGEAKAAWRKIEGSVAAGAVAPFDLSPLAVAPTAAKVGMLAGVKAKVVVAAVLLGGGGVAVVRAQRADDVGPALAASAPATRDAEGADDSPVDDRAHRARAAAASAGPAEPELVEPPPLATPEADAVPAPPVDDDAAEADAEATGGERPRRRARGHRSERREPAPSATPPGGIGRELALIRDASRQVAAKRHAAALEALRTHASEFPLGAMQEDREALRAIALCESGRRGAGQRVGRAFTKRWPASVHGTRVHEACDDRSNSKP